MNEALLYWDFREDRKPREKRNLNLSKEEYRKIQEDHLEWYPHYKRPKMKEKDINEIAFLGLSSKESENYPYKPIPYGDIIRESFQVDDVIYMRTDTGYFFRKENTKGIHSINKNIFDAKKPFKKVFESFKKTFPQAGLTRGSNWTNLTPEQKKKQRLEEIQNKYKEGVF
jgi:hypothetical protein